MSPSWQPIVASLTSCRYHRERVTRHSSLQTQIRWQARWSHDTARPSHGRLSHYHHSRRRRTNRRSGDRPPQPGWQQPYRVVTARQTNRPSGHHPPHARNTAASAITALAPHATLSPPPPPPPRLPLPSPQLPPPRSVACRARLSGLIRHADQATAMSSAAAGAPALKSYSHACIIRQNGRSAVWRRHGKRAYPGFGPAARRGRYGAQAQMRNKSRVGVMPV